MKKQYIIEDEELNIISNGSNTGFRALNKIRNHMNKNMGDKDMGLSKLNAEEIYGLICEAVDGLSATIEIVDYK